MDKAEEKAEIKEEMKESAEKVEDAAKEAKEEAKAEKAEAAVEKAVEKAEETAEKAAEGAEKAAEGAADAAKDAAAVGVSVARSKDQVVRPCPDFAVHQVPVDTPVATCFFVVPQDEIPQPVGCLVRRAFPVLKLKIHAGQRHGGSPSIPLQALRERCEQEKRGKHGIGIVLLLDLQLQCCDLFLLCENGGGQTRDQLSQLERVHHIGIVHRIQVIAIVDEEGKEVRDAHVSRVVGVWLKGEDDLRRLVGHNVQRFSCDLTLSMDGKRCQNDQAQQGDFPGE